MPVLEKGTLTSDNPPASASSAERTSLAADILRAAGRLRLRVRGESMLPSLWPGDVVEIARCSLADAEPGEIVLASRDGRFFLHRLLRRSATQFVLRGDSVPAPDAVYCAADLLGKLIARPSSQTSKQTQPVSPSRPWTRVLGLLFCYCGPARSLALKLHTSRKQDALQDRRIADATSQAAEIEAS